MYWHSIHHADAGKNAQSIHASFSGTVISEALNPSANFDIAALNYFVRDGDVFVGWTSKSVTVNTLKTWNPARYAPLE